MGPPPLAPPYPATTSSSPPPPSQEEEFGEFSSPPPSTENNPNSATLLNSNNPSPTNSNTPPHHEYDDDEEPLSPEFDIGVSTTTAASGRNNNTNNTIATTNNITDISPKAAEPRKRRPSSLKRLRAAALAAGVDIREEVDCTREELDFDFDSDSDGYARGSINIGMEDHETSSRADESDDLFLTPRRPGRENTTSSRAGSYTPETTPNGVGNETPGEYSTFDPVMALLDDHWALLKLGGNEDEPADGSVSSPGSPLTAAGDNLPDYLAPLSEDLLLSASALGASGKDINNSNLAYGSERQLMEALRDADTLEASCARYSEECAVLRKEANTNARKALRLERENDVAAREIHRLNAAMATLQAAHDVDRRINDLLLADQTEEIRALRKQIDINNSSNNNIVVRSPSATSSVSGEEEVGNNNNNNKVRGLHQEENGMILSNKAGGLGRNSRPKSARLRDEERANLLRRKESMFKEYEQRHSMTIQHVVRRSSLMALVAVGNTHLRRNSNIHDSINTTNTCTSSEDSSPVRNHHDEVLTPSP